MTSRSSTERLGDFFSESVVSHLVPGCLSGFFGLLLPVFGCVCWFCFWFCIGRHLLLLSPILQHVGIVSQKQYVLMTV